MLNGQDVNPASALAKQGRWWLVALSTDAAAMFNGFAFAAWLAAAEAPGTSASGSGSSPTSLGLAPNSGPAAGVDAARDTWRSGAPWAAAGVRLKVGLVAAAVAGPAFSAILMAGRCFVCNSPRETGPD